MKKIIVAIEIGLGYSHSGWCGTDGDVTIEVSDETAATLLSLIVAKRSADGEDAFLTMEDIEEAIDSNHPELQALHDEIIDHCKQAEIIYWCMEAYDCIDESLEPYFYEDVKDGLYQPEPDDCDSEEGYDPDSYEACRDNYLAWVRSHTDDAYFMAERLGIDAGVTDGDYDYTIKGIE